MSTTTVNTPMERITRLLALAGGTSHPDEAETAMRRAQLLAARHNVDLAYVEANLEAEERPIPQERVVTIGKARSAAVRDAVALLGCITEAHNVRFFVHTGKDVFVTMIGFPRSLDLVEALFESLLMQMMSSADEYLRTRTKHEMRTDWSGQQVKVHIHGKTARKNFNQSFIAAVESRLEEAQAEAEASAAQEHTAKENHSAALVLVEQKEQVDKARDEWAIRHNVKGSYTVGQVSRPSMDAMMAGVRSGQSADLGSGRRRSLPAATPN